MRTANALRMSGVLGLGAGCFSEANVARQLTVQRSDTMTDDEWQVSAAAVIGLQNLSGSGQPKAVFPLQVAAMPRNPYLGCGSNTKRKIELPKTVSLYARLVSDSCIQA